MNKSLLRTKVVFFNIFFEEQNITVIFFCNNAILRWKIINVLEFKPGSFGLCAHSIYRNVLTAGKTSI